MIFVKVSFTFTDKLHNLEIYTEINVMMLSNVLCM